MRFMRDAVAQCRFFLGHASRYWKWGVLTLLATGLAGCTDAAVAWSLRPYLDGLLVGRDAARLYYFPLLIVLFTILQGALKLASNYLAMWVSSRIITDIKLRMFQNLLGNETAFFDTTSSGAVLAHYNSDVDEACRGFFVNGKSLVMRLTTSTSLLLVMYFNSWILASVALSFLLLAIYPLMRLRRKIRDIRAKSHMTTTSILTAFNEAYAGNRVITAYDLRVPLTNNLRTSIVTQYRLALRLIRNTGGISILIHFIIAMGIAATIWVQGWLMSTNRITPGNFVSFMAALLLLYNPIKNLSGSVHALMGSKLAMERLQTSLERQPQIADADDAVEMPPFRSEIRYESVSFRYARGNEVLRDVSLVIAKGEKVAIVGESGGGKSTLVSLLPRFYDVTGGRILIDGVDIRKFGLKSLRASVAMVFQDNFLFHGTIRENILMGKPEAGREEIDAAVDSACLREFVSSLRDGLDTTIGERGILLSGGEKQRVAIARAFIRNAPILILDEATSALDSQSEAVVQQAIDNLGRGRTVLTIAHRLSSIVNSDRIAVVSKGRIVETGTHAELMARPEGRYAELHRRQGAKGNER